jgi:DNA helicase IV
LNDEVQRKRAIDIRSQDLDNLLERIWPQYSAVSFLQGLLGSRDRLLSAGGEEFTAAEIKLLSRRAAERVGDELWSAADIFLLDEVDALLNGVHEGQQFHHVVVDEAQDLSPMQLRALARRATTGSMTVVGDIAQSTGPWARDSWEDVLAHLPQDAVKRFDLEFGYRVPREVFDLAARLLPRIAPEIAAPRIVRDAPTDPEYVPVTPAGRVDASVKEAMRHAARGLSVGVIVPTAHRTPWRPDLRHKACSTSMLTAGIWEAPSISLAPSTPRAWSSTQWLSSSLRILSRSRTRGSGCCTSRLPAPPSICP